MAADPSDAPDIDETIGLPAPTGRDPLLGALLTIDWAEDVLVAGRIVTKLHHVDVDTGLDSVEILDTADQTTCCFQTKLHPTELDISGTK